MIYDLGISHLDAVNTRTSIGLRVGSTRTPVNPARCNRTDSSSVRRGWPLPCVTKPSGDARTRNRRPRGVRSSVPHHERSP